MVTKTTDTELIRLGTILDGFESRTKERLTDVTLTTSKHSKLISDLTTQMLMLTQNVSHLTKSVERTEEMLRQVGAHEERIKTVEGYKAMSDKKFEELMDRIDIRLESESKVTKERLDDLEQFVKTEISDLKTLVAVDKSKWAPLVLLAEHWKWLIGSIVAIIGVIGWHVIKKILVLIGTM